MNERDGFFVNGSIGRVVDFATIDDFRQDADDWGTALALLPEAATPPYDVMEVDIERLPSRIDQSATLYPVVQLFKIASQRAPIRFLAHPVKVGLDITQTITERDTRADEVPEEEESTISRIQVSSLNRI